MPKVSVVVPIYNVEKYLNRSLGSLKQQSLDDIEIICINNGSTDNSAQILDEFQKNDSRFVILSHEKESVGKARNEGIETAKGDYISFMDSDDTFERTALEDLYSQAAQQNDDVVIYNFQKVNEDYLPIPDGKRSVKECVKDYTDLSDGDVFTWERIKPKVFGLGGSFWAAWSKIFNAEFLKNNNIRFSDCNLCEDHLFTVESLLKAKKIGYKEKPVYNYMVRQGSVSRPKEPSDENFCVLKVFEEIKSLLSQLKLQDELKQEFNEYIEKITDFTLSRIKSKNEFKQKSEGFLIK